MEDWEKAADVMQRHLKVVPQQDGGSSEEAAMQALRRSLAEMQTILLDKCQAATDAADYKVCVGPCREPLHPLSCLACIPTLVLLLPMPCYLRARCACSPLAACGEASSRSVLAGSRCRCAGASRL